jgi:hypothetical protein
MREIVLDTETTGLDPSRGDRLVEIGAVEIIDKIASGRTFHVLINPQREVPEDAFRVHGHSTESLRDKPVFAAVVDDFLAFVGDDPLVIHNAEFDTRFLNAELARLDRATLAAERIINTLAPPTVSTPCATATASTARGASNMALCSTPKFWSKSIANCPAAASAVWGWRQASWPPPRPVADYRRNAQRRCQRGSTLRLSLPISRMSNRSGAGRSGLNI